MNLWNCITAYEQIGAVTVLRLPFSKSRKILGLKEKLQAEYSFYCQEEQKLVQEYADRDEAGNPVVDGARVTITDPERLRKCAGELEELRAMEVDLPFERLTITAAEMGEQAISADCIEALAPWIEFV